MESIVSSVSTLCTACGNLSLDNSKDGQQSPKKKRPDHCVNWDSPIRYDVQVMNHEKEKKEKKEKKRAITNKLT